MEDRKLDNYQVIDIKDLPKNTYFHYTSIDNLDSIFASGLKPLIGDNAMGIEKSKKVFFTIGINNSLTLMDSWIRWMIGKSIATVFGNKLSKPIYKFGTFLIKFKIFHFISTFLVKCELKTPFIKKKEYKNLKNILDNSIYLSLDLEYNIDYSLDDIDEVKAGKFDKNLVQLMYNNSDIEDIHMEYWNMHTFSNRVIAPEKLHLIKDGTSSKASDILEYMRKNTEIKIKKDLPYLYGYFKWLDKQK